MKEMITVYKGLVLANLDNPGILENEIKDMEKIICQFFYIKEEEFRKAYEEYVFKGTKVKEKWNPAEYPVYRELVSQGLDNMFRMVWRQTASKN